ncbi:MAG TPA: sigma factor [Gemmatimonadaceae bacterium]|nr:sigma factor [Gemmatimonadaceae bacterium]
MVERELSDCIRHYERFVRGRIEAIVPESDAVDDLVQRVWVALWKRLRVRSLAVGATAAWLKRVAHRQCLDWYRASGRRRRNEARACAEAGSGDGSPLIRDRWLASAHDQRRMDVALNAIARLQD